jgi:hypothetical protein
LRLQELKLGEPVIDSISDFRPTNIVLILNNLHIRVESFEICLFALAGRISSRLAEHRRWPVVGFDALQGNA